jgi:hypothetical protein
MKILSTFLATTLLLAAAPALADPPSDPPLPKLDVSTMLFLMLIDDARANTLDPIEINGFDIDFGDDDPDATDETLAALDDLLEGK